MEENETEEHGEKRKEMHGGWIVEGQGKRRAMERHGGYGTEGRKETWREWNGGTRKEGRNLFQ